MTGRRLGDSTDERPITDAQIEAATRAIVDMWRERLLSKQPEQLSEPKRLSAALDALLLNVMAAKGAGCSCWACASVGR